VQDGDRRLLVAVDAQALDDVGVGVIAGRAGGVEVVREPTGRRGHGERANDGESDPCERDEAPMAQSKMRD
jgi:hypothetical protein